MSGPAGRKAFADLEAHYDDSKPVPYDEALKRLSARDPAVRKQAGRYLLALLRQSFADEASGRGPCRPTPFWGGSQVCAARELRRKLAAAIGARARAPAALAAVVWLIDEEKLAPNQSAGMQALRAIRSPRVVPIVRRLLDRPHPNQAVLLQAIEAASERRLRSLGARLLRLCGSHRSQVRLAARRAVKALGLKAAPAPYDAVRALTPRLEQELRAIAAMVYTPIPAGARWVELAHTDPRRRRGGKPVTTRSGAWLLRETADRYGVLDHFARERTLERKHTTVKPSTLAQSAAALVALRANKGRRAWEHLSRRGGLTGQFEPGFVSLPEALVAAWALTRASDRRTAATLILPRIDATQDDRWLRWAVRDLLGHLYHQQMLQAFAYRRDYAGAGALARHLARDRFDDYGYQARARELAAQLARRGDDFTRLTLPPAGTWRAMQARMSREQQIHYLARRLRLLNCRQWGQPGGVSYESTQHDQPLHHTGTRNPVINPYVELDRMKLSAAELRHLVPLLADDDFMPTFSYWRDFHPGRTLHRVSWAVAQIINTAAGRELARPRQLRHMTAAEREAHIATILRWCRASASKPDSGAP